eukprot:TRINITY_DN26646_c0_g1_i1.p1 TRINITY_DN26646_c0_g1~~TRINITY_DN26646_c0_g1_i1.p1  ORF type:complete len:222 (+),score=33.90 TRINITY_DN26646_c0_g1_i1:43-708(+)
MGKPVFAGLVGAICLFIVFIFNITALSTLTWYLENFDLGAAEIQLQYGPASFAICDGTDNPDMDDCSSTAYDDSQFDDLTGTAEDNFIQLRVAGGLALAAGACGLLALCIGVLCQCGFAASGMVDSLEDNGKKLGSASICCPPLLGCNTFYVIFWWVAIFPYDLVDDSIGTENSSGVDEIGGSIILLIVSFILLCVCTPIVMLVVFCTLDGGSPKELMSGA